MIKTKLYKGLFLVILQVIFVPALIAQKLLKQERPIYTDKGRMFYTKDSLGNRIPDFSYCGYKASEESIPNVDVKVFVPVVNGDATLRIQSALDYVGSLPMGADGFRGAVLLQKGIYEVKGQLQLTRSGVVLRGSGMNANGTTIIGSGTERLPLIRVLGMEMLPIDSIKLKIIDVYVPVNALMFHVESSTAIAGKSKKIIIHRPSTKKWITTLGTDIFGGGISALGWKSGERDLFFYRTVTNVDGNTVTIDAPITTALDSSYGGASILFYNDNERINNVGIENLKLVSSFEKNNLKDEDHRWNAINIERSEDVWVRQISFENFAGSAVRILESSLRITVEDCNSSHPVSEIGGQRRYTYMTDGQQSLFQRCYAENGYHDFAIGFCVPGPNAFVQCESKNPQSFSGAIDSWSSGILFDVVNVEGNAMRFGNRGQDGNGAGWAAANSVFWNCSASRIDCYKPPTAQNWSFGSWSQFSGDGYWGESNNSISPRSLYYGQLAERLDKNVDHLSQLLNIPSEASSSPSVETAMELSRLASNPKMQLKQWIELSYKRNRIPISVAGVKAIDKIGLKKIQLIPKSPIVEIRNGLLLRDKKLVLGKRQSVQWWNGGLHAKDLQNSKPHITRFVPGRTGKGLTDDLNEVTDEMIATNTIAMEHNYGLWYDRRRDDHQRVKRMDGEVWPPFYELPFARSGKGIAWDGLSKYDLSKYNLFYWNRLKQFADLADQKGLILVHQNYFQHNIIEAGAHYSDFPWRSANNINNTGFVEPVNYAGEKRIFYAEQFYDISNPVRKLLHKNYIRQCLNNFKDNNGVIQFIGEEFTGPTLFVRFWLDVIKEWEKQTGKHPIVGLSVTKDVQDSILNDKSYESVIDLIDIRYWHYQADGSSYAPLGGQNLAPRQHARLLKPKKSSFEQVYRAVREYREKFPSKAVVYSGDNYNEFGMAVFMAGGSMPVLPKDIDSTLLYAAVGMKPIASSIPKEYVLSDGKNSIVYNSETKKISKRSQ